MPEARHGRKSAWLYPPRGRGSAWRGPPRAREVDRGGIAAADHHADTLAGVGPVAAGEQRGDAHCGAGLCNEAELFPKRALRRFDRGVLDQHHALDMLTRDREDALADAARCQRVRSNPASLGIDRRARGKRAGEGRRRLGLDPDDADGACIP